MKSENVRTSASPSLLHARCYRLHTCRGLSVLKAGFDMIFPSNAVHNTGVFSKASFFFSEGRAVQINNEFFRVIKGHAAPLYSAGLDPESVTTTAMTFYYTVSCANKIRILQTRTSCVMFTPRVLACARANDEDAACATRVYNYMLLTPYRDVFTPLQSNVNY